MEAIGKYQILKRLAVGGMGEIFLARERGVAGFDRLVVVKRLLPDMADRADSVALFLDEARIVAHLAHPNIVQVYELGEDQGAYFIAMEYVPGQNLARICERATRLTENPLTRRIATHVVAELAHGLDFAHRATNLDGTPLQVVHRDVSPHNLLLSVHGDVKVMDFGIAKATNSTHRTQTGVIRGKYAYMSPEQLAGENVDATTDVYAAGVVLWELTLQRRMFRARDELQLIDLVRAGSFTRPSELDPSYPRELEDIAMAALVRDPRKRTASAGELARQLREYLASSGSPISRASLGTLVTSLFPEVDHLAPARVADEPADVRTASMPASPGTATATTTPQAPEVNVIEPAAVSAPTVPSRSAPLLVVVEPNGPISAQRRPRRWQLLSVLLVGSIAVSTILIVRARAERVQEQKPVASAHVATGAELREPATVPIDAASAVATAADAAPPILVDAPSPGSIARSQPAPDGSRVRARRTDSSVTPPVTPRVTLPVSPEKVSATPVTDAVPPAATGTLIVDATPWGTVSGNGFAPGATPRRIALAAGIHEIKLTLSDGGATSRARARIVAGKRTKCTATQQQELACASPD